MKIHGICGCSKVNKINTVGKGAIKSEGILVKFYDIFISKLGICTQQRVLSTSFKVTSGCNVAIAFDQCESRQLAC